jgi:hypothetical protein
VIVSNSTDNVAVAHIKTQCKRRIEAISASVDAPHPSARLCAAHEGGPVEKLAGCCLSRKRPDQCSFVMANCRHQRGSKSLAVMNNTDHFSMTLPLPQVALLAGVPSQSIHLSIAKAGNWRDLIPMQLPNGRYAFPMDGVHAVLGRVPKWCNMTHGERFYADYLDLEGIPLTESHWNIGKALLSREIDYGRAPSDYVKQVYFICEIVQAWSERFYKVTPTMDESGRELVRNAHLMIASLVAAIDETEEGAGRDK